MIDLDSYGPHGADAFDLDFRTTEEIEDAADDLYDSHRETLTGLPARPGTRR